MKTKTYPFAPGVLVRQPRRRLLSAARVATIARAALGLAPGAILLTLAAASIGWLLGGVL